MKNRKTLFRLFSIADFEEEEAFLRGERMKGWKYENLIFPGFYKFTECEPQDVIYRLDYNAASGAEKGAYLKMFSDCGWTYEGDKFGWSYFSKATAEEDMNEEIFSDMESKLELFDRIFKSRMQPLLIIFGCIIAPMLFLFSVKWYVSGCVNPWYLGLAITYAALFVTYVIIFATVGRKFAALKRKYRRDE